MVVTEQIDALRAMAVPPVKHLVVPRLLAALFMLPILGVLGDIAGVSGSMVMSAAGGVPTQAFLESVRTYVDSADFLNGLIKTVWFGLTISLTACHQGLKTSGGATGVGRATTNSVVICVVLIFVSDFFLAQMLTGGQVGAR
jgi:phospholipid/cholesterol/gamma-HCH transport system permease protein